MEPVLAVLLGYLFGSIPFGLLLTKAAGLGDVRKIGSGNIGATNVLRTGNKGLAAGTLLLDLAKGFVPVFLAWQIWGFDSALHDTPDAALLEPVPLAALGAVLGHCFPVWLKLNGGKGVATNAGVAFGLAWPLGLAYAVVWIGILVLVRISSLAGMSAVVAAAIAAALFLYTGFLPVLATIAVLIIVLHRENLGRLARGEEPKIGSKK
ncbi:MAG: glycerol-3-phosphate 1-O-acyltransferase PlsY [Erythrobacter sp.]|nr:glycerol-3-phosphate 1-O-acyltransferase PlsY [Erythrobacter sp.]